MRVLVTRPEPEASDLALRLTAAGHTALVQPMMRIVFSAEPIGLPMPAAIAVTSRNGVRALERWRVATGWRALPVYAVGAATADAAREAEFADVRVGAGDVAGLAALIRADYPHNGAVLYPAARDRAADLAPLLPGFWLVTVEAYRGEAATALDPAAAEAIAAGGVDAALFFSRRTAEIFAGLVIAAGVAPQLAGATFYALSRQVAEPLAGLGVGRIRIPPRPEEAGLLGLLDPALAHHS